MARLRKGLFHNPFHRHKESRNVEAETNQAKIQEDSTINVLLPTSPSQSNIQPTQPTQPTLPTLPTQSTQSFRPLDLWKTAYDQLDDEERRILSTIQIPTNPNKKGKNSQVNVLISQVISITEEQYEKYQQKADGKLRESSQKIINAALSFKDIIGAIAASDPTNHAASAWTIVSLGLTMVKNHNSLRDALFESSEYLADVLTQCAFIEKNFYLGGEISIKDDLGNAMIRLYRAILHYAAQIRNAQERGIGRKLFDCVTAITEHPLTELKASVEKERDYLFQWIGLVKHLHREKEAENIICQIDKIAESMKHLIEQFSLVNLQVAEGAFYDSYINEHEDFCLPDTRTEIRSQILEWADSTDNRCIFWLNGMAGTGKSTIARTVAQSFHDKGQLGATFFFKRGEADRGNAKYLISTIARQLVTRHRPLVPDVLNAIENDPNISSNFLSSQFDKLLLQPLLNLRLNQPTTTVIVIDALDECSDDGTITIWDAKTGAVVRTLEGHSDSVQSVAFSCEGQTLASGSRDRTIKIWDTKIGTELQMLEGHSDSVQSVAFSHDGQTLASGSCDCTIKPWDTKTGTEMQILKGHLDSVQSVVFSYDGRTLASGSYDCTIKIWDIKTGTELQVLEGHVYAVKSVVFSYDGQTLASGSRDGFIKLWDAKTGTELQMLEGHVYSVKSVAFSHDGQTLASGSRNGTVKIWDAKTGTELQMLESHVYGVQAVAYSHNGQILFLGFNDGTVKIWDAKTGTELQTLKCHPNSVQSVVNTLHVEGYTGTTFSSIPLLHDDCDPTSYNSDPQVSLSGNWVTFGG
ncbi:WD40-repeat-containing domain protein [Aspergillus leporis]|uniref:Mitochondrial division protein 1 n=1 Tax=Aspergillus leporis TaxID=41062 RepID=A0A5N5X6A6_9EURO|nr:WD40-repeat-containing domain protein [Aspergillus leporis]